MSSNCKIVIKFFRHFLIGNLIAHFHEAGFLVMWIPIESSFSDNHNNMLFLFDIRLLLTELVDRTNRIILSTVIISPNVMGKLKEIVPSIKHDEYSGSIIKFTEKRSTTD